MNIRSIAQDSVMSLHSNNNYFDYTTVFEIEAVQKYKVRSALALMGISEDRIYSDLNVAAKVFAEALSFDSLFG